MADPSPELLALNRKSLYVPTLMERLEVCERGIVCLQNTIDDLIDAVDTRFKSIERTSAVFAELSPEEDDGIDERG